jgi:cell division protease FtsH
MNGLRVSETVAFTDLACAQVQRLRQGTRDAFGARMKPPLRERLRSLRGVFPVLMLAVLTLWVLQGVIRRPSRELSYTEFTQALDQGLIEEATFHPDQINVVLRAPADPAVVQRVPNIDDGALVKALTQHSVVVRGVPERSSGLGNVLWSTFALVGLPLLMWGFLSRGVARTGPMTFGRSKAKLYDTSAQNQVTFADVAGVDEAKAELLEVVHFLKEPQPYRAIGAHIPKGVLLVGAPGTGKTLLARAVAGESQVAFFTMSGSEFVEMFVGVGASRVRDLFEQAKGRAPCIIFIDELDAVGKSRAGPQAMAGNDEREQTLNQLLVEMDGFDASAGLVIMAATNRPEILDRALLRAGRFDRQVLVDRPDVRGREAILAVHAKKVLLGPDVDLKVYAQRTPGMVGADLANVVNEAALASVRRASLRVEAVDFEEAIDRLQLGLKKEGRVMTDDEKRRVAFHEAGHALVARSMAHADPVHRVTIIPRSIGALGATLQLPTQERYVMTISELRDRLCVLLGGRAAEALACGEVSTGSEDDLERATELARLMVSRFGMSETLGPVTQAESGSRFLGATSGQPRAVSEETARAIDRELRELLSHELTRACTVLETQRPSLEALAEALLVRETLTHADLDELVRPPTTKREVRVIG